MCIVGIDCKSPLIVNRSICKRTLDNVFYVTNRENLVDHNTRKIVYM